MLIIADEGIGREAQGWYEGNDRDKTRIEADSLRE
jgi:hypothetical protein